MSTPSIYGEYAQYLPKILQKNIERMTVSHAFCVILKKTDRLGD